MRQMSIVIFSGLILFVAACTAPPVGQPPAPAGSTTLLDANPLENIANTRRISRVYLRGREVDRAGLRTKLKRGSAAATRPPTTE